MNPLLNPLFAVRRWFVYVALHAIAPHDGLRNSIQNVAHAPHDCMHVFVFYHPVCINLFMYSFLHILIYSFIYLFVWIPSYLANYLLFTYVFLDLLVYLVLCLFFYLSICLGCLSIYLCGFNSCIDLCFDYSSIYLLIHLHVLASLSVYVLLINVFICRFIH